MQAHSRRTFVQLGGLAAAGTFLAKFEPALAVDALQAAPAASSLTNLRLRLIPARAGVDLLEHARIIRLATIAELKPIARAGARLAVHDALRELMEDVPLDAPVSGRARPTGDLSWFVELWAGTWQAQRSAVDQRAVAAAEERVFASVGQDPSAPARAYWKQVSAYLHDDAGALGVALHTRVRSVYRLDYPAAGAGSWRSTKTALNDVDAGARAIAAHVRGFVPRANWYLEHPDQILERSLYSTLGAAHGADRLGWPFAFNHLRAYPAR